MDELILEFIKGVILAKVFEQQQPGRVWEGDRSCGCGSCSCGEKHRDLDRMEDLDEGEPYLWS